MLVSVATAHVQTRLVAWAMSASVGTITMGTLTWPMDAKVKLKFFIFRFTNPDSLFYTILAYIGTPP